MATQGDILKMDGLIVEKFTMKANTDATKGLLYCDDGSGGGLVAATAALAAVNKVVMALEDHDYSEKTSHVISCVVKGTVAAAKVSGSGLAYVNSKLMISGTAGQVTKFVAGTAPGGGSSTYYTTAIDAAILASAITNIGVVGYATKLTADADTVQEMWLGS